MNKSGWHLTSPPVWLIRCTMFRRQGGGSTRAKLEDGEVLRVLTRLLVLYIDPSTARHQRLQQALAVFFQFFAGELEQP